MKNTARQNLSKAGLYGHRVTIHQGNLAALPHSNYMANLIVSTTCNNEPMNRAITKIAADHLSGVPEITEGLLNNIEVGVRAYDPCLSCATHAIGQMPLEVTLIDSQGNTLDRETRP